MERNANIDFCGIKKLLQLLKQQGFSENELKRIEARLAARTGASIIFV